ncbi:hypothetical protein [Aquimarina longa]|uniref:hypothetical protein n=1 Tax=Aquimarina longa TaxID=1080221 RepID=UPI000B23AF74|nr:hypothetical protein [Aquimarina longa]
MKTIKIIFAVLLLSPLFIACEADSVDEQVGIEEQTDIIGGEDAADEIPPE